nr:hypothetical protein BgiMline_004250 [Biomphalaria glabrata]
MRDSARCPRFQSLHFRQSVKVKSRPGRKSFGRPPFPSTPHGRVDSSNIGAHLDLQDCAGLRSDQHVRRHCVNFAAVPDSETGAISTGGSSLSPTHTLRSPSPFTLSCRIRCESHNRDSPVQDTAISKCTLTAGILEQF